MGVFGNITGIFGSSGSVFMIIVLAVADHLWGENVFNCPCGGYRILYTCAFIIVPPVVIIIIDTNWRVLVGTCQQCFAQWNGRCKRCCCCSRKTCEMVTRLIIRPIIIAILWLVFSGMEPKFGRCIFREVSCNCTQQEMELGCTPYEKEKKAQLRVAIATFCLASTCMAYVFGLLYIICTGCVPCTLRSCANICFRLNCGKAVCESCTLRLSKRQGDEEAQQKQMELTRCLFALGVEPKTVLKLQEEKLMAERTLMGLSDFTICRELRGGISLGQLEILKALRKDIRLMRWLLAQKCKPDNARRIIAEADRLGPIIDTIRNSLDKTNEVGDEEHKALWATIRENGLGSLLH